MYDSPKRDQLPPSSRDAASIRLKARSKTPNISGDASIALSIPQRMSIDQSPQSRMVLSSYVKLI